MLTEITKISDDLSKVFCCAPGCVEEKSSEVTTYSSQNLKMYIAKHELASKFISFQLEMSSVCGFW